MNSLSHWGVFPGFFIAGGVSANGYSTAVWRPVTFEEWCAMQDDQRRGSK